MKRLFDEVAATNHVLPLDPRFGERAHPNPPPPGGRDFYTFYPGAVQLFDATAPGTRNRTHTITAYLELPSSGSSGVVVADGGLSSGYALYLTDGRPSYTYNYLRRQVTTISGRERLAPGRVRIDVQFAYDGGGEGLGATVALLVNGALVDRARLE